MKNTTTCLLLGLLGLGSVAQANCNANIPLTRLDSRYETVAGATPENSEVRDTVTGLVWQRCVVGMTWSSASSSCIGAANNLTWQNALDAARTATASTATSGGVAAWRVPNHAELYSLAERACYNPAINNTWFPMTPGGLAWSSSPLPVSALVGQAIVVSFSNGSAFPWPNGNLNHVRLVRSGP